MTHTFQLHFHLLRDKTLPQAFNEPGACRIETGNARNINDRGFSLVRVLQAAHLVIDKIDALRYPATVHPYMAHAVVLRQINLRRRVVGGSCFVGSVGQHGLPHIRVVERPKYCVPEGISMHNTLNITVERYPIAGKFTISRGSKTEAAVVVCAISNGSRQGRGECVPYARYGESIESVSAQIEAVRSAIEKRRATRQDIQNLMPAGAARNAVDCALWDLEAKQSGKSVADMLGMPPRPLETAITVSLGTPSEMAESAAKVAHYPLIKVKMGGENDIEKIRAVADAAPNSRIIIDANEGWTADNIAENMRAAAAAGVVLIEQPLPADNDQILSEIERPVTICADESVHTSVGLEELATRYDESTSSSIKREG